MLPCDSSALPSLNNFLASPVAATSTSATSTFSATEGADKATKLVHPAISITPRLETPFCGAKPDANESQRIKKDAHIRCSDETGFDLVMASMVIQKSDCYSMTQPTSPMRKEDQVLGKMRNIIVSPRDKVLCYTWKQKLWRLNLKIEQEMIQLQQPGTTY